MIMKLNTKVISVSKVKWMESILPSWWLLIYFGETEGGFTSLICCSWILMHCCKGQYVTHTPADLHEFELHSAGEDFTHWVKRNRKVTANQVCKSLLVMLFSVIVIRFDQTSIFFLQPFKKTVLNTVYQNNLFFYPSLSPLSTVLPSSLHSLLGSTINPWMSPLSFYINATVYYGFLFLCDDERYSCRNRSHFTRGERATRQELDGGKSSSPPAPRFSCDHTGG